MRSKVKRVTPQMARKWLEESVGRNWRKLSKRDAARFAAIMAAGDWDENGEPFIFDEEGKLIDGQTRADALQQAGVSLDFVIVEGVKSDRNIDTGRRRTLGQLMSHLGYKKPSALASITRATYIYENLGERGNLVVQGSCDVSNNVLVSWMQENEKEMQHSADVCQKTRFMGPPSVFGTAHYLFQDRGGRDRADEFMEGIITGDNMDFGDAPLQLRERLMRDKRSQKSVTRLLILYGLIKAWNLWIRDEKISKFYLQTGKDLVLPEVNTPE